MTTYRTDNHWGVTIVREQPIDGMTAVDAQLVAVVVNGDQALAERICALLNGAELGNPRGYHPTCIETTGHAEMVKGERSFVCGPDCPPPPDPPATTGNPRCSHCVVEGRRCPACVDREGPETGLRSTQSAQGASVGGSDVREAQRRSQADTSRARCTPDGPTRAAAGSTARRTASATRALDAGRNAQRRHGRTRADAAGPEYGRVDEPAGPGLLTSRGGDLTWTSQTRSSPAGRTWSAGLSRAGCGRRQPPTSTSSAES